MKRKPYFMDVAALEEDRRIDMIGHHVMDHKEVASFITDSNIGKAERYIEKLQIKFPGIRIIERGNGPVQGTVWVKVGPPLE